MFETLVGELVLKTLVGSNLQMLGDKFQLKGIANHAGIRKFYTTITVRFHHGELLQ